MLHAPYLKAQTIPANSGTPVADELRVFVLGDGWYGEGCRRTLDGKNGAADLSISSKC